MRVLHSWLGSEWAIFRLWVARSTDSLMIEVIQQLYSREIGSISSRFIHLNPSHVCFSITCNLPSIDRPKIRFLWLRWDPVMQCISVSQSPVWCATRNCSLKRVVTLLTHLPGVCVLRVPFFRPFLKGSQGKTVFFALTPA